MRGVRYLISAVVALGLVVLAGTFLLPRRVHVERSVTVGRPMCTVYALVDGFGRQREWSPWAPRDPAMAMELSGPPRGVGAKMVWRSAVDTVGNGEQQVTAASPCQFVQTALRFEGMGESTVQFVLAPDGAQTRVVWSIERDVGFNPVGRLVGVMFDRWIGPDFEDGLARLKALAETLPDTDFAGLQVEEAQIEPVPLATVVATAEKSPHAVGMALGASYAQIEAALAPHGVVVAGARRATFLEAPTGWSIAAALPVRGIPDPPLPPGPVRIVPGYAGRALRATDRPGTDVDLAWARLRTWAAAYGQAASVTPGWVEYVTDPATTAEDQLVPVLILPLG